MGRLFWKFFLFFWLAQVVTSAGVGIAIWLNHSDHLGAPGAFGVPPPPPEFRGMDPRFAPEFPGGDPGKPPSLYAGEPPPHRLPMPLLPILAGSFVSLLFAGLLAWYFARPIRSLRAAFGAVAAGELETRIGASMGRRNDELADLGNDFDHMAGRLQSLINTQRRLLHDVSHELRSPLARLQAATGLMRQQPERSLEFVERIERDCGRMDSLVGELLTLARLDAGMTGKLDETVDLGKIVGDIANDAQFEAEAKTCTVSVKLNGVLRVRGSRDLLHRALENVVRNAVCHSPEHGIVGIEAASEATPGYLRIAVSDQGPGVSEADLNAIFEPFFRSESSGSYSGYGLGLAIARRVVAANGGTIVATNRPAGGLTVTLLLPSLN